MKRYRNGLIAFVVLIIFIYPVLYMAFMSFKPSLEIFSGLLQVRPTTQNYIDLFARLQLAHYFVNSIIVALGSSLIALLAGGLAAYSFARFFFRGRKFLLFLVLFTRMMPPIGAIIPLFLVVTKLGLSDTYFTLIILYAALDTPLVIWMMRGFFVGIPGELEEQALVDGCTRISAFFRILVPVSAPGFAATAIFAFTLGWNDFMFALVFTASRAKTIPVAVPQLIGEMGIQWGQISAAGTLAIVPIVLLAFFAQRNLIRGLTFGAVKG